MSEVPAIETHYRFVLTFQDKNSARWTCDCGQFDDVQKPEYGYSGTSLRAAAKREHRAHMVAQINAEDDPSEVPWEVLITEDPDYPREELSWKAELMFPSAVARHIPSFETRRAESRDAVLRLITELAEVKRRRYVPVEQRAAKPERITLFADEGDSPS